MTDAMWDGALGVFLIVFGSLMMLSLVASGVLKAWRLEGLASRWRANAKAANPTTRSPTL